MPKQDKFIKEYAELCVKYGYIITAAMSPFVVRMENKDPGLIL